MNSSSRLTETEIVGHCVKCGRQFLSLPDHVKTDAYGIAKKVVGPKGWPRTQVEVCGGRIERHALKSVGVDVSELTEREGYENASLA